MPISTARIPKPATHRKWSELSWPEKMQMGDAEVPCFCPQQGDPWWSDPDVICGSCWLRMTLTGNIPLDVYGWGGSHAGTGLGKMMRVNAMEYHGLC